MAFLNGASKGQFAPYLRVAKDITDYIDRHRDDEAPSRVTTSLFQHVHNEFVHREMQDLDQSSDALNQFQMDMAVPIEVMVGLEVFDALLIPERTLCQKVYSKGKEFYNQFRKRAGFETYPGLGLTMYCDVRSESSYRQNCISDDDIERIEARGDLLVTKEELAYKYELQFGQAEQVVANEVCNTVTNAAFSAASLAASYYGMATNAGNDDADDVASVESASKIGGNTVAFPDSNASTVISTFLSQTNAQFLHRYNYTLAWLPVLVEGLYNSRGGVAAQHLLVAHFQVDFGLDSVRYPDGGDYDYNRDHFHELVAAGTPLCSQVTKWVARTGGTMQLPPRSDVEELGYGDDLYNQLSIAANVQRPRAAESFYAMHKSQLDFDIPTLLNATLVSISAANAAGQEENVHFLLAIAEAAIAAGMEACEFFTSRAGSVRSKNNPCEHLHAFSESVVVRLGETVCTNDEISTFRSEAIPKFEGRDDVTEAAKNLIDDIVNLL